MHRAVHLLVAFAALGALIIGGAVLLKHAAHLEPLLPAPSHHSQRPTRSGEKATPGRMPTRHPRHVVHTRPRPPAHTSFADSFMRRASAYLGLAGWVGLLALGIAGATTVDCRLRKRLSRHYERYEIKLSMHDDAKPG